MSDEGQVLTTTEALDLIAYERAPRLAYLDGRPSNINRWLQCADGFTVSVQASWAHYAIDSAGERPGLNDEPVAYPYRAFEIGAPSEDPSAVLGDSDDSVWGYVPVEQVIELLDSHGGVVAWFDHEANRGSQ